ncbi:hypothetical protein BSKO_00308 [Bryopsis sp. KO-2023]|nr:hypothetical protein BSKO_00308 [Bryopsis sp. KO-2023]
MTGSGGPYVVRRHWILPKIAAIQVSGMTEDESKRPKVGVGVLICKDGKVIVGQRKNALGAGEHSLPGGHLEHGEDFDVCAIREVKEETGLDLKNCRKREVLSHLIHGKHYVTVYMSGDIDEGAEPRTMEPDKCEGWFWADWDDLPAPLFPPLKGLYDSGFKPFE